MMSTITGCTMRHPPGVTHPLGFLLLLVVAAGASSSALRAAQSASPVSPPPILAVDVVVIDRDGRPVGTLGPAAFAVTVDGQARRIAWVRHVSRGPGAASDAAARIAGRAAVVSAAEPARNVLVVVDETSLARGSERAAAQVAGALLDRLGLDDRVGVVRLPTLRDTRVTLTTDRPAVQEALRQVVGVAVAPAARTDQPAAQTKPQSVVGIDRPDPTSSSVMDPVSGGDPATYARADEAGAASRSLPALERLLIALKGVPGRKVVAVFSAGLTTDGRSRVDDVARAAISGHAVVYGFGLPALPDGLPVAIDSSALERLARLTGGSFTRLSKNVERSLEKVVTELSACYVLGIESTPSDAGEHPGALRIDMTEPRVTLRAPSWLVAHGDAPDVMPPGADHAVADPATTPPALPPAAPRPDTKAPAGRDPALQQVLARAVGYVANYEREYSALVAEEEYVQRSGSDYRRLRSDLLLVRVSRMEGWVEFRDVFEVNGTPVRDRDDRVRKLFLDPGAEAKAQLKAIKEESARYNIGQVERNINVPTFPLQFLDEQNLSRFRFRLGGRQDVKGIQGLRLEYEEVTRPTLTLFNGDQDLPARGWFVVDPLSGAVLETRVTMEYPNGRAQFLVRYQRDARLGLWIPAEMQETYFKPGAAMGTRLQSMAAEWSTAMEARATYSNFRRFQTQVEEAIAVPKPQ